MSDAPKFIAPGGSEVFMSPKGWIEIVWGTRIDPDEYMLVAKEMLTLITAVEDGGTEPLGLFDFSRLDTITPAAAGLATSATKSLPFARMVGVGVKPQTRLIIDAIKEKSTKADIINDFPERAQAEAWLMKSH